jgi:ketosteroid isomerase-like protein
MSPETQRLIREGYAALSRADLDAWVAGVDPEAELHELPEMPDTAVYRGQQGFRAWAESVIQLVEEWAWTPEEFIFDGDDVQVVRVLLEVRGQESGVPIKQTVFHFFRFENGLINEVRGYTNRQDALKAAGVE